MKKLVNLRNYVAIGSDEYCDTSIWNHIRYVEEGECNTIEYTLETFEEAFSEVADKCIRNAQIGTTLFRHHPTIEIEWGSINRPKSEMTEKTFKPLRVKWEYKEVTKLYTIKDLSNLLPADQFCEWLKDKGITVINSL